jgi:hypothetical protein
MLLTPILSPLPTCLLQLGNLTTAYEYTIRSLEFEGYKMPRIEKKFAVIKAFLKNMLTLKKRPSKKYMVQIEANKKMQEKVMRTAKFLMQAAETYFFMNLKMHYAFAILATINELKKLPKPTPEYAVNATK